MQVPAPFEYERASSVDEAIALLERHGEDARLIAGGHSLLPLMKLRLASPEVLVDINDLTDLQRIWVENDELQSVRWSAMPICSPPRSSVSTTASFTTRSG